MTHRHALHRSLRALLVSLCMATPIATRASAQVAAKSGTVPHDEARERALMSQVKVADGFTATLFAAPPIAMYPVCLTGTIDGAVFVCVDPNLSLTAAKGKGRIVRLIDTDHDGKADRYSVFAEMDSPRGVAYDGRTLYVMHPPNLTAYRDTTGDGIADVQEDLVTGLGFDLDFRGADHTTNGITMGIDGWIYIAVGDYGFQKAVGKDGTTLSHRGGGVVRVRTDGTGLELYAQGTRNMYDIAVDPLLHVFSRDNTNDGDGWQIRLHYIPAGAHMGYPMYYKNFSNEHMQSLADYGDGSGTGGLFVYDNGMPRGFANSLYTSDWLLGQVFRHPLTQKGGSYDVKQESFVSVPHPADMAMDGMSNMFVASLAGGEYTYGGDSVGYVIRVSPTRAKAPTAPNLPTLTDAALRALVVGANSLPALQAQRELLRRGERTGVVAGLTASIMNTKLNAYARVAAMFTLRQLVGVRSHATLRAAASAADPQVRALALRALVDDTKQLADVTPALYVKALADTSAPVQLAALAGLVRRNAVSAAAAIMPLTASTDATVSHIAINAIVSLNAADAALLALDSKTPGVRAGALRALQLIRDPKVVSALIAKATAERAEPSLDLIVALARLYHTDVEWTGDWWGTRPAFLGPYFNPTPWAQSATIAPVLRRALLTASAADLPALTDDFIRNRVLPQGAKAVILASATNDAQRADVVNTLVGSVALTANALPLLTRLNAGGAGQRTSVAQLLANESSIIDGAMPLARAAAADTTLPEDTRAALLNKIAAMPGRAGTDAAASLFATMTPTPSPAGTTAAPVEAAWRRFVGDRRRLQELDYFVDRSRAAQSGTRALGFAVLLQSVRGGRAAPVVNEKVQPVLTAAWISHEAAPDLVRAVQIMRLESAYTAQLDAYRTAAVKPVDHAAMDWVQMFNGKDLNDWDIKFAGSPVGVNYRDTYRVEEGLLKVRYDHWPDFNGEFGHIFYKKPYSYYIVAAEYRFVGEQVKGAGGGNSWAIRNNGIMVHSQSAQSMGLKQDFPISLEVQLLGGLGKGTRTNGNLCTPGTNVVMNDQLITTHCINSSSLTYDGDQWVRVEAMVLGDSVIKHIVNGDTVLTYNKPQMGGGAANYTNPGVLMEGKLLSEGYITLQAETAPIDFRKVEIVNLKGCMNPTDQHFRKYFVKSDPAACRKQ